MLMCDGMMLLLVCFVDAASELLNVKIKSNRKMRVNLFHCVQTA